MAYIVLVPGFLFPPLAFAQGHDTLVYETEVIGYSVESRPIGVQRIGSGPVDLLVVEWERNIAGVKALLEAVAEESPKLVRGFTR